MSKYVNYENIKEIAARILAKINKTYIGLGNVENKSSETIRSEITPENIEKALGYLPSSGDTFLEMTYEEYYNLLLNNQVQDDVYYTITDDDLQPNLMISVTFPYSGWTESLDNDGNTIYTQTISVQGVGEDDSPILIKDKQSSMTAAASKAYNKAFGILTDGCGETGQGTITWTCYKKPAINITVGLIQLLYKSGIYASNDVYLVDENGNQLTNEDGNSLIVRE